MNYIVLDLEWNQSPNGKASENSKLPFEIVEIGAVKLDENRNKVDEYHQYIAPAVYHELHYITQGILGISMRELRNGKKFALAAPEFFSWCGEPGSFMFCTWGSMDLTELQRNCAFHEIGYQFDYPLVYADLQKMFSLCYSDGKTRSSLEDATEQMELPKDVSFHSAMNDAVYTAKIMERMDFKRVSAFTSVDTYRIPMTRREEYTMHYPTYTKFVSKGYEDREEMVKDGYLMTTPCPVCGKSCRKKIRWFAANPKSYYCIAECSEHGFIKGRMKMRKTETDLSYAVKILKPTDAEGVAKIKDRQLTCRERRRERRHREKEHKS